MLKNEFVITGVLGNPTYNKFLTVLNGLLDIFEKKMRQKYQHWRYFALVENIFVFIIVSRGYFLTNK